jgi:hypothetical protein
MPTLALLFHLIEAVDGGAGGPVGLGAARRAAAWCDFLEAHVRRVYQAGFDGDPDPARRLADRVRRGSLPDRFTARQVVQHGWSGLDTTEAVDRAVATLERLGWVRCVEIPTGSRPATWVFVNPRVMGRSAP